MELENLPGDTEGGLKVIKSQFSKYFDYGGNSGCIQGDNMRLKEEIKDDRFRV